MLKQQVRVGSLGNRQQLTVYQLQFLSFDATITIWSDTAEWGMVGLIHRNKFG